MFFHEKVRGAKIDVFWVKATAADKGMLYVELWETSQVVKRLVFVMHFVWR